MRWIGLFAAARLGATVLAVGLLFVHTVTSYDVLLAAVGVAYGGGSTLLAALRPDVRASRIAWLIDVMVVLALIGASEQWRSPFYVMALTTLIFPATELPFRHAIIATSAFTVAYLGVAVIVGVDINELQSTPRLESFATHLIMPGLAATALAYATALLTERERTARLAIEAERRRIAWELHDSAKQRVHAAHLVLGPIADRAEGPERESLEQALSELRAAAADMETSLSDLQTPLEGRRLDEAIKVRAKEIGSAARLPIEVTGRTPDVPTFVAAHAFRVASEAMTNAARHSAASRVRVQLGARNGSLIVSVTDDGRGMPEEARPGSHGLPAMAARAETLGGSLEIRPGPSGRGTAVKLAVPLDGNVT